MTVHGSVDHPRTPARKARATMAKLQRCVGFCRHDGTPEPQKISDHDVKRIIRHLWSIGPSVGGNDSTLIGRLEIAASSEICSIPVRCSRYLTDLLIFRTACTGTALFITLPVYLCKSYRAARRLMITITSFVCVCKNTTKRSRK